MYPLQKDENDDQNIVQRAKQLGRGIMYLMNSSRYESFKEFENIINTVQYGKVGVKERNGILICKVTKDKGSTIFEISIDGILNLFRKAKILE
jgi:hypothetical protein